MCLGPGRNLVGVSRVRLVMTGVAMTWTVAGLEARYRVLLPYLDERARRLVLGADATAFGYGGIAMVARSAGVDPKTVTAGVDELDAGGGPLPAGRVRGVGAGRPRAETRNPGLVAALLGLVEPTRRGDPMSPLSWTCLSTRRLAATLTTAGHAVSRTTVAGLLKANGFSLQGNAKTVEGASHPDRDAQFGYLDARVKEFLVAGDPVISVDTKKKELVGNYKNNGREWAPADTPTRVNVHDFKGPLGRANPYGVSQHSHQSGLVSSKSYFSDSPRARRISSRTISRTRCSVSGCSVPIGAVAARRRALVGALT